MQAYLASLAPEETELEKIQKSLQAELESLKKQIEDLAKQPGEGKSTPEVPDIDIPVEGEDSPAARLAAYNKQVAAASAAGGEVRFTSPVQ